MWNKIEKGADIKTGINVKKYPLEGDPVNTIDLGDSRNSLTYQINMIKQVDGPDDEITLTVLSTASPDIHDTLSTKTSATAGNATLVKMRKEFTEENCWWIFTADRLEIL